MNNTKYNNNYIVLKIFHMFLKSTLLSISIEVLSIIVLLNIREVDFLKV